MKIKNAEKETLNFPISYGMGVCAGTPNASCWIYRSSTSTGKLSDSLEPKWLWVIVMPTHWGQGV